VSACAVWCDNDDDGDGMTGEDVDMATGDNGLCCACSFGSLCRGRAADASAGAAPSPGAAAVRRRRWQRRGSGARFAHLAWDRAAAVSACAARRRDDDDDGDGVTGADWKFG